MANKAALLNEAVHNGRVEGYTMSLTEVAQGLVAACREGNFLGAIDRYYAPNVHSIEPSGTSHIPAEMVGVESVKAKNHW
jgi:hypothetical protein